MAIVNAVIDERKTRPVKSSTKKETFFSNNTADLTIDLDSPANDIPERITEPLVGWLQRSGRDSRRLAG